MKYEIQTKCKNDDTWYMVALADTQEWARKIVDSLNICEEREFRFVKREILKEG